MDAGRPGEVRIPIVSDADIVSARQEGRALAQEAGFATTDLTLVATAISEVARNIVTHAESGKIEMRLVERPGFRGVMIVASDAGPGIVDVEQALMDGFTTAQGLGLGLPGARRIMDEFTVDSTPGQGTTVVMRKWARTDG